MPAGKPERWGKPNRTLLQLGGAYFFPIPRVPAYLPAAFGPWTGERGSPMRLYNLDTWDWTKAPHDRPWRTTSASHKFVH